MPRGHLNERYVQKTAVEWIANYYREHHHTKAIVPAMEVRVSKNSKRGFGRADGLIVSQLTDGTIFTASLEAKSSRTKKNLLLNPKSVWLLHAGLIGAIGFVSTELSVGTYGGWFWSFIAPVLVFIVFGLIFLAVTYNHSRYLWNDVIQQALRYPANEHWIALSSDVYNLLQNERVPFNNVCQRQGIGLVRVSAGKRVEIIVHPISKPLPKNLANFLDCYAKANVIRAELLAALSEGEPIVETLLLEEPQNKTNNDDTDATQLESMNEKSDNAEIS